MEITKQYYRVEKKNISFLKFIFEAYDGIAIITTVDRPKGIVMFRIPPGCENDVDVVLQDLGKKMMIEECDSFLKSPNMLSQ